MTKQNESRGRKRSPEKTVNIGIGLSYRKRLERLAMHKRPVQTLRQAAEAAILARYEAVFGE